MKKSIHTQRKLRDNLVIIAPLVFVLLAGAYIILPAFAHSHLTITSDKENIGPIEVIVGHTNEPSFGAKPGIHDGKHSVQVTIMDKATKIPLSGANLTVDKYYFENIGAFNNASSLDNATEIQKNAKLKAVFGDPGSYISRQIVKDGIYGYTINGTIDYFEMAKVPINSTIFCNSIEGNTTKFNSKGWERGYGCIENIDNLLFPKENNTSNSSMPLS